MTKQKLQNPFGDLAQKSNAAELCLGNLLRTELAAVKHILTDFGPPAAGNMTVITCSTTTTEYLCSRSLCQCMGEQTVSYIHTIGHI